MIRDCCLCRCVWAKLKLSWSPISHYLTRLTSGSNLPPPKKAFHTDTFAPRPSPRPSRWDSKWSKITYSATQSLHLSLRSARTASFSSFLPSLSPPPTLTRFFFLLDHRNSTKTRAGSAEWHRPFLLWCVFVMSELCGVGWCLCSPALWWLWGMWREERAFDVLVCL